MFFAYLGMGIVGFMCGCFALWKFLMYHLMVEEKEEFLWRMISGISGEMAQSLKDAFVEMARESAPNGEGNNETETKKEEESSD